MSPALTNYNCVSAGDGTSLYLSKLPNVTLAGITDSCRCNQETGGHCVRSGGVPNVETKADRISRKPLVRTYEHNLTYTAVYTTYTKAKFAWWASS